jgi:hypothetical protein
LIKLIILSAHYPLILNKVFTDSQLRWLTKHCRIIVNYNSVKIVCVFNLTLGDKNGF